MLHGNKRRFVFALLLILSLLLAVANGRLAAQGNTGGSILGTVTDSSGAVVAGARVQVTNVGTNGVQSATTDASGRYRVPALPVGDYDVQGENAGFQTAIRKGIRISPGADVVVDIALTVGQVNQTVVVEAEAAQVDTTSSALGTVVEPTQMRDLPLNGRNFQELVQLVPGVSASASNATKSAFTGNGAYWSVSGARPNGQELLMDGTNIQTYQNRGTGSSIMGTSLGVDAIGEFQMLTNTYGAQYGGNGGVMNSVTRSGTNTLHGSGYEFTRNSIFDGISWPATEKPPFWKHQFGGTLGGPIKKDKMFFFVNYEGVRQNLTDSNVMVVPNNLAHIGVIPSTSATISGCVVTTAYPVPANAKAGSKMFDCGPTTANAAKFNLIKPYLDQYPLGPNSKGDVGGMSIPAYDKATYSSLTDLGDGTGNITIGAAAPGREDLVVGRYDWTLSQKDSLFARYMIDNATTQEPFYAASNHLPQWPEYEYERNQFLTIGDKRIISDTLVNSFQGGYTRTWFSIYNQSIHPTTTPGVLPAGSLNWLGDIYTLYGIPIQDASMSVGGGVTGLAGGTTPVFKTQIRKSLTDDLFWIKGAHSLRFGGGVTFSSTDGVHYASGSGGVWAFPSLTGFLTASPTSFAGVCNYSNGAPACLFPDGKTPLPFPNDFRAARQTEFVMYVQDDWKVRPSLTLNIGLRYAPTTNPYDATYQTHELIPVPYGYQGPNPIADPTNALPTTFTALQNFFLNNPSLHNFDPRIGLAWAPFKNQKTSVRAGFGIFHAVLQCRDYCYTSWFSQPMTQFTVTDSPTLQAWFPQPYKTPFLANSTKLALGGASSRQFGTDPWGRTPYTQQWNLAVQQQLMRNTILTVAYVGSRGVHMLVHRDVNPSLASGMVNSSTGLGVINLNATETLWANFPGYLNNLVFTSGGGSFGTNANANFGPVGAPIAVCPASAGPAGCTLATQNGASIINPATGRPSFSHIIQTTAAANPFNVVANTRFNPNFAGLNSGVADSPSSYNALQVGLERRMTNGLQASFGYTFSNCLDISSGNWGLEGSNRNMYPYDPHADWGHCFYWAKHNLSINSVYALPFKGNRLADGWQIGGIAYYSSGNPFEIQGPAQIGFDIGLGQGPRPDLTLDAPGCNGQPVNGTSAIAANGNVQYINPACLRAAPIGELGSLAKGAIIGPKQVNMNASVQKNTKLSERFNLQIRVEGFNVINHRNFATPAVGFTQGAKTSAATVASAVPNATSGQITGVYSPARQLQLGAKLTF